jgi:hypothetical protein
MNVFDPDPDPDPAVAFLKKTFFFVNAARANMHKYSILVVMSENLCFPSFFMTEDIINLLLRDI